MNAGCRPLKPDEVDTLNKYFDNAPFHRHLNRDYLLIHMGFAIGWRMSELLQIKVSDVWDFKNNRVLDYVRIEKNKVKKKIQGKSSLISNDLKKMVEKYIVKYSLPLKEEYLFQSPMIIGDNKTLPLGYRQALRIVKKHFINAGLDPSNLSTHTLRKVFSDRVYKAVDYDLISLQAAMGHKSVNSTAAYVQVNKEKVEDVLSKLKFV